MTPEQKAWLLLTVVKLLAVFTLYMVTITYLTLLERKLAAWFQNRLGPNRVGPSGLLQPIADGIKAVLKQETLPAQSAKAVFVMAPSLAFIPALTLCALIPVAAPVDFSFDWTLPLVGRMTWDGPLPMVVADVPAGFLLILAISSIGVYGIALAGWSSNSKYSLLGGLRSSAQMVSYEVAAGLSVVPVLLLSGNVSMGEVIRAQQASTWYVLPLFLSYFFFLLAGFAETNRLPFDLPEAESELIAGYHTEYSGMKFSLFFIAEYANMITVSAVTVTLFFGGWDIPFTAWDQSGGWLPALASFALFGLKVFLFIFVFMWVRWTLPRFRYDQLMALGWKLLVPVLLAYVMLIAVALVVVEQGLGVTSPLARNLALFGVNLVAGWLVFFVLDRGLVIRGVAGRAPPADRSLPEAS
ncbi:MAG TPA: NADH-quinone oxidoreductase subunit NuoH [Gemmatimonadales bacterium]|nr:NADH-quinone oxidoreductase subunit NuoH [Gemmatimonadales bacterium]